MIQSAIEEFAQEFAAVIRRFTLEGMEGCRAHRRGRGVCARAAIGELAIGRTSVALKAKGHAVELRPIRHHSRRRRPYGSIHRVPSWMLAGHDAILAVDMGGSNIRAGIVEFHRKKNGTLSDASVHRFELWRHRDDAAKREDAVTKLIGFLLELVKRAAKDELTLAPFIGIGGPLVIRADGSIEREPEPARQLGG
jgi:hypothetical protein